MVRGLLLLGALAVLLLLLAMGTGLADWPLHWAIGVAAVGLAAAVPWLAMACLGAIDRWVGSASPPKFRARLMPFSAWMAVLLVLTAAIGGYSSRLGPLGRIHGFLGGLATGFGPVAMVVAWASVVARVRILRGRRS